MRLIVRREKPHPGAGLTLFEQHDGYRYQAFATNTAHGQLAFLEAGTAPAHARVEDRIRTAKDTGLGRLPSREWTINNAWVHIAAPKCGSGCCMFPPGPPAAADDAAPAAPSLSLGRPDRRGLPPDHDHPRADLIGPSPRPPPAKDHRRPPGVNRPTTTPQTPRNAAITHQDQQRSDRDNS